MNGTIRVWSTDAYECLARASHLFDLSVSALTFFRGSSQRLIAVDKVGNLKELAFRIDGRSSPSQRYSLDLKRERTSVGCCDKLDGCLQAFMHQFSQTGDVVMCLRQERTLNQSSTGSKDVIDVLKLADKDEENTKISIEFNDVRIRLPVLSENGRSLLIWSPHDQPNRTEGISGNSSICCESYVVPRLDYRTNSQEIVDMKGKRVSWGQGGEYLLVWDKVERKPRLSVYKTHSLRKDQDKLSNPVFEKELILGLSDWKARMLPRTLWNNRGPEVLIYEICEGRRIISVWDIERKIKTGEMKMAFTPERAATGLQSGLPKRSMTMKTKEHEQNAVSDDVLATAGQDVFLDFCATNDKSWIGAVAWDYQTVGMSSMKAGVTAWFETLDAELLKQRMVVTKEIKFDPFEQHLLLIGDGVIQAISPSFLAKTRTKSGNYVEEIPQALTSFDDLARRQKLLDAYRCLPSKMLAKLWEVGTVSTRLRLAWFRNRHDERSRCRKIMDAALSPDNNLLALIVCRHADASYIFVRDARPEEPEHHDKFAGLRFPMEIENRKEKFWPERIFLYKNTGGDDCMALLSTGRWPVVVFGNFKEEQPKIVSLTMINACLMISQGRDSNTLLLLDRKSVCVLDLQKQQVTNCVAYQSDLGVLIEMVQNSLQWRRGRHNAREEQHPECRISEDGQAVLLAWDVKRQRSIVITRGMRQNDCEALIRAASGCLSECCTLSATGSYTAFFDVKDLAENKVTIGLFSEKDEKITFRLELGQDKQMDVTETDTIKILSNVFYGISKDETCIFVGTLKTDASDRSSDPLLQDQLQRFKILPTTRCIPDQDLRRLMDGRKESKLVDELYNLHGCSLFNTPLATRQTVFQDAFQKENLATIKRIKEIAEDQKFELSLEWQESQPNEKIQPDEHSRDILQESIESKCTNKIKEAIATVNAGITPFSSAAKIMKGCFKDLLLNHSSMLERMLGDNSLVQEVCQLNVHVDFTEPSLRRDKAVHINTTDTYLDWSHHSDQQSLGEMWHKQNFKEVEKMKMGGDTSTKTTTLNFIRIEDAAKTGMTGIIRPLLLKKVPAYFFEFDVVKWIVMYKWLKIWRKRFIWQGLKYLCFLIFFVLYAVFLSTTAALSEASLTIKVFTSSFLAVTAIFGMWMTIDELRQMCTYMREGEKYFHNRWLGLWYFMGFYWNHVDLFSCLLLVILIPLFHVLALLQKDFDHFLSVFVAMEAIVAFTKIWYYAQPFRRFGSLVRMVGDVGKDCIAFLALGFTILFGFAVALHVLFRHITSAADNKEKGTNELCESEDEEVKISFGNLARSLLALFYAILGAFESETFLSGELPSLTTFVFVGYLLIQMIVLLNFLISIMGDTFDRVRYNEEGELLIGRAEFIDACEASLSDTERQKINDEIGRYVHVLKDRDTNEWSEAETPKHWTLASKEWSGRIRHIEDTIKKLMKRTEENIKNLIRERTDNLQVGNPVQEENVGAAECQSRQLGEIREDLKKALERTEQLEQFMNQTGTKLDELDKKLDTIFASLPKG